MADAIRRVITSIHVVFDLSAGGRRYRPTRFSYPSTEESWCKDWENIGGDFRRAAFRIQSERV